MLYRATRNFTHLLLLGVSALAALFHALEVQVERVIFLLCNRNYNILYTNVEIYNEVLKQAFYVLFSQIGRWAFFVVLCLPHNLG